MVDRLLEVKNLRTHFYTHDGKIPAVDGISFAIKKGESVGVVGESGCGKSVTALSIMGLISSPPGKIETGEIIFEDEDLLKKSEKEMRDIRGNHISMIFQNPMTYLNPVHTIGSQIGEALKLHLGLNRRERKNRTIELLELVGIPLPERRIGDYPHQMSGGMRQRVMIAMALSCNPRFLIADEPTTALDVTVQAQILEIMKDMKRRMGMATLLITHDLGVVAEMTERVIVMYSGKIVEEAPVKDLFKDPQHPYTRGLLASMPRLDASDERLYAIEGVVPQPSDLPRGCRFSPRCDLVLEKCASHEPPLRSIGDNRCVSCWIGVDGYGMGATS